MINIPQNVNDPFYRYQREKIKLSNQKLGFKIDNLELIGKAIYLNPKTIYGCNKLYCENIGSYFQTKYKNIDFRSIRFPGIISSLIYGLKAFCFKRLRANLIAFTEVFTSYSSLQ